MFQLTACLRVRLHVQCRFGQVQTRPDANTALLAPEEVSGARAAFQQQPERQCDRFGLVAARQFKGCLLDRFYWRPCG
jgi:hypothetical protein